MSDWNVKFRGANGPENVTISASTQEEAEATFFEWLIEEERFGALLQVVPMSGMDAPI